MHCATFITYLLSIKLIKIFFQTKPNNFKSDSVVESIKNWCVAWWHSGQEEDSFEDLNDWYDGEGEQSCGEYGTPCSAETPVQSSVSR